MARTHLTKQGLEKLEILLKELQAQKRRLSAEGGKARELGDLRENGEYHAARERLQQVLQKIGELESKLVEVNVVDPSQLTMDAAILGTRVKVKDMTTSREDTYTLVGPDETDPSAGKISIESPLGRAFLGHKVKDEVIVTLPGGVRPYKILAILPVE